MAFESRKGGRQYYYRAQRAADGRVVKQYLGGGPAAQAAAKADSQRRQELQEARAASHAALDELVGVAAPLDEHGRMCDMLVKAELLLAGYHEHKGRWRKRRIRND
jgi:hypothetical protein